MKNFDLSLLFARIGLGICLFMHGFSKILHGVDNVKAILIKSGLPGFFGYFAYIGEFIAPLMIILGLYSRIGAVLVLGTCITILYSFYGFSNLFQLEQNGGFNAEIVYLYISIASCLLFSGSGKYAVKRD